MTRCVKGALCDAGTAPEEVDYVNAHATATLQGDAAEAEAIRRVFGAAVPVSSLKGHIGHTLGASGALELVASVEMIRRNAIVPTLNLEEVAADCAGINLPKKPLLDARLRRVVKNSFAFGGVNASIVVAPFES
jgi:3-oxoacyl-[acyl-carrier-protein] synthase II